METNRFFRKMYEGEGNTGDGENTGDKIPKTFEWKSTDGKIYTLPDVEGVKEAIGKSSAWGRKEASKKYQTQVNDLQGLLSQKTQDLDAINAKMEELQEAGLSDIEKNKKQQERLANQTKQQIETLTNDVNSWKGKYEADKKKIDISSALSKYELCNPNQTMMMISSLGGASVVETDGEYKTVLNAKSLNILDDAGIALDAELSPKEAVEKFLALPENAYHLKNNLRAGGGTSSQTGGRIGADGTINYTRADLQQDPAKRKEYHEKLKKGEQVSIVE